MEKLMFDKLTEILTALNHVIEILEPGSNNDQTESDTTGDTTEQTGENTEQGTTGDNNTEPETAGNGEG